jgi:hypothetical protein
MELAGTPLYRCSISIHVLLLFHFWWLSITLWAVYLHDNSKKVHKDQELCDKSRNRINRVQVLFKQFTVWPWIRKCKFRIVSWITGLLFCTNTTRWIQSLISTSTNQKSEQIYFCIRFIKITMMWMISIRLIFAFKSYVLSYIMINACLMFQFTY